MSRSTAICLTAGILAVWPARAACAEPPLCKVGSSVVNLLYLQSTGAGTRIDPALVGSSLVFLAECPASVISAFSRFSDDDPDLWRVWIAAVRSAVRDSSNVEVRGLLTVAKERVARLGDRVLNHHLDGTFNDLAKRPGTDRVPLESLFDHQARATLKQHSECDGEGCSFASDNLLFLLGTHPVAVFSAMHADSVDAAHWLDVVGDESFAGPAEDRDNREAVRQIVLKRVAETSAHAFESERRASEETLRKIRFRAWQ